MFENLGACPRIVVTGPQRSGTLITTHMIAWDTGHAPVDEIEFGVYKTDLFDELLTRPGIVVHCPTMLKHVVDCPRDDVLVVLVRRSLDEIHASQTRINWRQYESWELAQFGRTEGDSAAIKYQYWDEHPKPPHFFEVNYDDLTSHPLFIDADLRRGFHAKQVSL